MVCSMSWSRFFEARGEPTCVCGHVWVEQLESETMFLTDVPKVVMGLVAVAWGAVSPRAPAHGKVVAIVGP